MKAQNRSPRRTRRSKSCFDKIVAHDKNLWVKWGEEEEEGEVEEEEEEEEKEGAS